MMPRKQLPFPSIMVASRDDPYMTWNQSREYAGIWGSGIIDLGNAGHINIASGHGRWPDAYRIARSLTRNSETLQTLAAEQRGVSHANIAHSAAR